MIYSINDTNTGYQIVNQRGVVMYEVYKSQVIVSARNAHNSKIVCDRKSISVRVREPTGIPVTIGTLYAGNPHLESSYFGSDNHRPASHFNPLTDYTYGNGVVEIDFGEKTVFCRNVTFGVNEIWTFHGLVIIDKNSETSSYIFLGNRLPQLNVPGRYHPEHFVICNYD